MNRHERRAQKQKWHAEQPRDGDIVLTCGHDDKSYHWFKVAAGKLTFVRPDKTTGSTNWIICCGPCFMQYGEDPKKIPIRGDGVWQGDAPVIHGGS